LGEWEPEPRLVRPGVLSEGIACARGHQGSGVDTVGRSEGTAARRASRVGAAVGVLSHRSGEVQSGEAQTGRERGRVREGRGGREEKGGVRADTRRQTADRPQHGMAAAATRDGRRAMTGPLRGEGKRLRGRRGWWWWGGGCREGKSAQAGTGKRIEVRESDFPAFDQLRKAFSRSKTLSLQRPLQGKRFLG
jgi:hypothetical protein